LELEFPRKAWNIKSTINANGMGVIPHDQREKVAYDKRSEDGAFQNTQVLEHYRASVIKYLQPEIAKHSQEL